LIENVLIKSELKIKVGADLPALVKKKIPPFQESAAAVYGLTGAEFKELVLTPQAHRELLEGRLSLENADFQSWLHEARQNAAVYIFINGLKWNGTEVVTVK